MTGTVLAATVDVSGGTALTFFFPVGVFVVIGAVLYLLLFNRPHRRVPPQPLSAAAGPTAPTADTGRAASGTASGGTATGGGAESHGANFVAGPDESGATGEPIDAATAGDSGAGDAADPGTAEAQE